MQDSGEKKRLLGFSVCVFEHVHICTGVHAHVTMHTGTCLFRHTCAHMHAQLNVQMYTHDTHV